jgi:AcrR family transcriptional regulator
MEHRLLDAVTEVAARDGFAALTVEHVLSASGASRATFYHYFPTGVEECFFSAYRLHAERLVCDVQLAMKSAPDPALGAVDALVEMAVSRPSAARMLAIEGLASGPRGLTERQTLLDAIEQMIDGAPARPRIELPAVALIGGTLRYIAMRLATGDMHASAAADVREWARTFARGSRAPVWQLAVPKSVEPSARASSGIEGLPRSGPQRVRVIRAAAALVHRKGYRACSVADIVGVAGVSRRLFYDHFEDKRAVVVAAYEYGFERTLAACAPAFHASGSWEERIWQAWLAFARFFARELAFGHLAFGQCYALGPSYAKRIGDIHLAFTWFLDARYRAGDGAARHQAASALTAAAAAELSLQSFRHGSGLQMLGQLPLMMYVILTPFIGRERACAFANTKLEESRERSA